ncbi:hypothetical protein GCM10027067_18990 [Pseudactinotalea suaedae]
MGDQRNGEPRISQGLDFGTYVAMKEDTEQRSASLEEYMGEVRADPRQLLSSPVAIAIGNDRRDPLVGGHQQRADADLDADRAGAGEV